MLSLGVMSLCPYRQPLYEGWKFRAGGAVGAACYAQLQGLQGLQGHL